MCYSTIKYVLHKICSGSSYAYSLFQLPSNRFTPFFNKTPVCIAMVTVLGKAFLQNTWFGTDDSNLLYINNTYLAKLMDKLSK